MWNPATAQAYAASAPFYNSSLPYKLPNLTLAPADAKTATTYMSDINTFVGEQTANFMTGKRPLDEFDAYIADLQKMGIDDVLRIYNEAYTVWNQPR